MSFQETFKALSDPTRRAVLELLRNGATVSHHLAVLKEAGLVSDDRQGKYIYYELNLSVLDEITGWVAGLKGDTHHEK